MTENETLNSLNRFDLIRSWHFNNETLQLQYILSAKGRTANLSDLSYSFSKEPCPVEGCPAPSIGNNGYESRWRRWSVSSDWPNNQVPLPGANVTINSSWRMYVDVAEVNVEKLEIQGILQFEDTRDIVFNATWVRLHEVADMCELVVVRVHSCLDTHHWK